MKIDPRHLEIVAAIVDEGGLTEGAQALGKSQPSVSRSLAQLEARIGTPLFHPGRRPLQPTELGHALAEQGRRVRDADDIAASLVTRYLSGHAGSVRVAGTPVFMDGVITAMLAEFQKEARDVHVHQSYGYADELIQRLNADALDFAVCPLRRDAVPDGFSFQAILPGLNVIACRAGHPLARKRALSLLDIAPYPWIAPPPDSPLFQDLKRAVSSIGVDDFRISFSGGSLASVISVLTESDSLTVLPYAVVFLQRNKKTLTELPLKISHPERELGILTTSDATNTPAATRLKSFVANRFEGLASRILQHQRNVTWRGG
ncbi:MAG: LysR family transcriptional regulator [Dinoroseobacter sp.]|nr:LysR family transcriptional regulator [Dinoroseobacter sp.]